MANTDKIHIQIEGMHCNNCALGVKRFLEKKGMTDVNVDFASEEATFLGIPETNLNELVNGIEKLGFKVVDEEDIKEADPNAWSPIVKKLVIAAIFTIPVFLAMFLPFEILHQPWLQFMLTLPVMAIGIQHFGVSAYYSLKTGVPNMDVLIIIGSSAAFIYSTIGWYLGLGPDFLFFETAATIITLVLLGNYFEHRSVKQTTVALKDLQALKAERAHLITVDANGVEQIKEVPVEEIRAGQSFLVNTGDKIPADGEVIWGESSVNEAMMTGESNTVRKKIGDEVIGATIVESGSIKIKATKVGKDSVLAQIIQMVKDAQNNKPAIHRLADRIAAIFVPVVLAIATLTFVIEYFLLGWTMQESLLNSIAVMVIACPCAMGLATPTALMVGLGKAAQNGILIKGGNTIEMLANVKNIVFDKTGTLTTGKFKVSEYKSFIDEAEFKAIVTGLEKHSSHPIARSVVRDFNDITPKEMAMVNEVKGIGLKGSDAEQNTYQAGSYRIAKHLTQEDQHKIYVLKNDELIGWIDLKDELRNQVKESVQGLKAEGINTILLSGDKQEKTEAMAQHLGIAEYYGEQMPAHKLEMISQKNEEGMTAMVGDGINDAPALAQAGIGISLRQANQVAIQSADVVLMNDNLDTLNKTVKISKATLTTIKQNLFWAFFYNVLAIPIAAIGLLNPMIAAITMALSDVIVIGNSLRLRGRKLW